jgi:hypothetical protein
LPVLDEMRSISTTVMTGTMDEMGK